MRHRQRLLFLIAGSSVTAALLAPVAPAVAWDVRGDAVYNHATQAYVSALWRLDETSGSTAVDDAAAAGYSNGTWPSSGVTRGVPGAQWGKHAAEFDGSGSAITVPNSPDVALPEPSFSIAFWARSVRAVSSYPGLLRRGDAATPDGWLVWYDAQGRVHFKRAGIDVASPVGSLTGTALRNFVVTHDGSSTRWYVDGVLASSASTTYPAMAGTAPLLIGRGDQAGAHVLDDVAIHPAALSQLQVSLGRDAAGGCRGERRPYDGVLPLPGRHPDVAVSRDSAKVFVAAQDLESVEFVDSATGRAQCPLHLGAPVTGISLTADGTALWAASGRSLVEVNPVDRTVRRRLFPSLLPEETLVDVGVTNDGRAVVVTGLRALVMDLATGSVTRVLTDGRAPQGDYAPVSGVVESSGNGSKVYLASQTSEGTVAVFDPASGTLASKMFNIYVRNLEVDRYGDRAVVSGERGTYLLDHRLHRVGTGARSDVWHGAAISADGRVVWTVPAMSPWAVQYDAARGMLRTGATVPVPGRRQGESHLPYGFATLTPDRSLLITVVTDGLALSRTENATAPAVPPACPSTGTQGAVRTVERPADAVVSADGRRAWVALTGRNAVVPVDLATMQVGCEIPVGSRPGGLSLAPSGTRLWVALQGAEAVSVVDTTTGVESSRLTVPAQAGGETPSAVAADAYGGAVVSTGQRDLPGRLTHVTADGAVSYLDGGSGDAVAATPDGKRIVAVSTAFSTTSLWSVAGPDYTTITRGPVLGGFAEGLATSDGAAVTLVARAPVGGGYDTTAVLDGSGREVSTIPVEADAVAMSRDGRRGWVVSGNSAVEYDLTTPSAPVRLRSLPIPDITSPAPSRRSASLSRDGRVLVITTDRGLAVLRV